MAAAGEPKSVLVVDDEPGIRDMLVGFLQAKGYGARAAPGGDEAISLIGEWRPDLVLLDLLMPGTSGIEVLTRIKDADARIPVVFVSGCASVDSAVTAMKLGADDFLTKPLKLSELLRVVKHSLDCSDDADADAGAAATAPRASLPDLMGHSDAIAGVCSLVEQVADTNLTVILYGETGAGKSLVAGAIHAASRRAGKRPVRVDCGAIPDTLIESELFGHERGAFTGAVARNEGYFELADGGTLFLDEIANLSEAMMRKLLCALEDRRIYRVGGKEPIDVDLRVLAASNQNLDELVKRGAFRRDLFHRLNEFVIDIPPLRKRPQDIPYLAQRFLAAANAELQRAVCGFSPQAAEVLRSYEWPGNVRELRNVVKRAVLLSGDTIEPDHLLAASASCSPAALPPTHGPNPALDQVCQGHWSLKDITRECVRQIEQQIITAVLERTGGNRSKAARILNVDYKTLYYKAKEMGH